MVQSQRSDPVADVLPSVLARHASELYDDSRLNPLLRQLIRTSCRLGDAMGGSVSLVDGIQGRYTKVAEVGTACRLGQSFPISEGVTGEVLKRRAPVVLRTYRDLRSGHLKAGHPAADGAVVAIPVWWRADIVAVNVIFAGVSRTFTTGEVDHLELVSQVVAAGLVAAVERELPGHPSSRRPPAVVLGPADVVPEVPAPSVSDMIAGLIELTHHTAPIDPSKASGLQIRVFGDVERHRLLFRSDPGGVSEAQATGTPWHELIDTAAGVVTIPATNADDPDAVSPASDRGAGRTSAGDQNPFSLREKEVATLLSQGLSDRVIAQQLFLAAKTVEKHVSAVLRKTGTTSRTAAVVRCMEQGWV